MKVGINTIPLKTAHKLRGVGYYTQNLILSLRKDPRLEVVEFTDLSKLNNVDLVHYPWFDFYFHTLPIRKKFKSVVTIHDTIPLVFPEHYPVGLKGKINFILQKISLKNIQAVITDSNCSKNDIIKFLKLKESKIFSIPIAAEENFKILDNIKLIKAKRRLNLPNQYLLYVGDANWVKNLPLLIDGFSKIIKKNNFNDLKLILVGGVFLKKVENIDHPELESLKRVNRLIKELDLEDKIIRCGNVEKEDLVAIYNLATIYIQPSIYEGFGLPVLEALSCGTPVVCSNGGSLKEVGGNSVVYFDPKNLSQFVSALEQVLKDKSVQNKLATLALKRASQFSWDKVAQQTKNVYSKVLNEK